MWECCKGQTDTDRQTHRWLWLVCISPRICLMRNVKICNIFGEGSCLQHWKVVMSLGEDLFTCFSVHVLFLWGKCTLSFLEDVSTNILSWMLFFVTGCIDRGLRKHLLPVVSGALERDRQRQMTFEQFFGLANSFYALRVHHVRCLDTFVLHRLYLPESATWVCFLLLIFCTGTETVQVTPLRRTLASSP